jgi:hypothetical protein
MPKSVNSKQKLGISIARTYCPYSSGPRNLPIKIVPIARIMVEIIDPDIRKNPPRADCSMTLATSSFREPHHP